MSPITPQLLNADGVRQHYSIPRSTLYALMRAEGFPKPVPLSVRRVAWRAADIETWLNERTSAMQQGGAA